MPTPSNNSIAAAIAARTTCPPEPERISAWRDSPDTVSNSDPLDALSPEIPIAPSMLSRSDDSSTPEPMKSEGKPTGVEEDDPVRATSPAESTSLRSQSPTAPPGSSLLNWEFSNVRVSIDPTDGLCHLLTIVIASAEPHLVSSLRQQVRRNSAIRPPGLQCRCRDQACGYG